MKIIRSIPKAFGGVSKLIPGGGGGKIMKFLKPLKGFFSTFGKVLPTFFKVGKIFGRLLLPITIITSLFDFVKGAMAGFDKYKDKGFLEGLIGGLLGGISGLAQGLIGMPLDLLKSAISWVAEKLGFENFSEMLDSFSFSELIGGLFTKVTDVIVGFIGSIKEKIAGIGVGGLLKNVALNLLKIFKKVYSFPMAVASGAAAALAAALPGGETPMEAFKAGFARVFNAGDDKIDSFKAVSAGGGSGDEVSEEGLAIKDGVEPEKGFFGRLFGSKDEVESVPEEIAAGSSNSVGAQMEFGMSNIADAKSQGTPVIVSGGSSPQSTVVNNTSATYNGSGHVDESNSLIVPQYVPMGGY